jgi:predicted esterase
MTARFSADLPRSLRASSAAHGSLPQQRDEAPAALSVEPVAVALQVDGTLQQPDLLNEIHVPDHYESRYAYPLMVWLAPANAPHGAFRAVMRRISERNFIGVVARPVDDQSVQDEVCDVVRRVRQRYHVHTERIHLAGIGEQGALALQVGFRQPEWFGGIVALTPRWPRQKRLLARFDAVRGMRVFLAADCDDASQVETVSRMQRLLWTAGLAVEACRFPVRDKVAGAICRRIDRWMIDGIRMAPLAARCD